MRSKIALWLSVAMVIIGLAASVGGSYALAIYSIDQSNQNWCQALNLLTSQPVKAPADPSANPSRVQQYKLYTDFVAIEKRFGC